MANKRISGITVEIGGDTTSLQKSLADVDKQLRNTTAELKDVNRLLKLDPQNAELLSQKQKILTSAISETTQRLKELKNAEQQVQQQVARGTASEEQYRGLQREIAETEQNLKSLESAANQCESALNNCADGGDFDKLGSSAEQAGKRAEKSSDGFTVVKGALSDLVSDGIGKAIDAFKDLGLEGETALKKTQASAGLSNERMKGVADTIKKVYKSGKGESFEGLTESAGEVLQIFGDINDEDLSKILSNTSTLESVLGSDTTETLRAVNSLMKQFGISSEQAFNLIAQGAQNRLNQNGDLLDTINEYSVQFKHLGFSADDMFNMLANGASAGTWSVDKLGDAVKEFNIRLSDSTSAEALQKLGFNADEIKAKVSAGGAEGAAALQQVMQGLASVDNETERYTLGQQLMGTMWEDLGEDAVFALMNTEGSIKSTNDAMAQMDTTATDSAQASFDKLSRTVSMDVAEALSGLMELLQPIFEWLSENQLVLYVIIGAIAAIAAGMAAYTIAQWAANAAMWASPVTWIVAAIVALIAVIALIIAYWDEVCAAMKAAWDAMVTWLGGVGDWIYNNVIAPVVNFFTGLWNAITGGVKAAWDFVVNLVVGIANWINTNVFQPIANFFKALWDGMVAVAKGALNGIIGLLNLAIDGLNLILSPLRLIVWGIGKALGADWSFNQVKIPNIPKLAKGGIISRGMALVGEAGPELLTVAGGKTQVTPLSSGDKANVAGAGASYVFNIDTLNNYDTNNTAGDLCDAVMRRIEFKTQRRGVCV